VAPARVAPARVAPARVAPARVAAGRVAAGTGGDVPAPAGGRRSARGAGRR
jgi:hypothetical protein